MLTSARRVITIISTFSLLTPGRDLADLLFNEVYEIRLSPEEVEGLYRVVFKTLKPQRCPFYKGGFCTAKGVKVGVECNYTVPYEKALRKLKRGRDVISLLRGLGYVRICTVYKLPLHLSLVPFLVFILFRNLSSLIFSVSLSLILLAVASSTAERRVVFLGET